MSVAKVVVPTLIDEPGCTVQRVPRDSPFWGRRARPYSPCRRDIVTFVNFLAPVVASIVVGGVQITLYLLGRRSTGESRGVVQLVRVILCGGGSDCAFFGVGVSITSWWVSAGVGRRCASWCLVITRLSAMCVLVCCVRSWRPPGAR